MGDSYNDVNMLKEAHQGVLFKPAAECDRRVSPVSRGDHL
jgi:phosphoserine phosphatase